MAVTKEKVLEILRTVKDPELNRDLVSLGMIREVKVEGELVKVEVALTTGGCPLKKQIADEVKRAVSTLPEVSEVEVELSVMTPEERARIFGAKPKKEHLGIRDVRFVLAVASGKGGVGKSTVSVNLAVALNLKGFKTGIMDADLYGPNVPLLMGFDEAERPEVVAGKIQPLVRHGVKVMSFAFLAPPGQPFVWRGPLVGKALRELAEVVEWGPLDFLLVDLPPGTGDAPLSVCQTYQPKGVIMVTTPQELSVADVRRCAKMFEDLKVPVLGLVENMAYLRLEGREVSVFGEGGGERLSRELRVPLLIRIPLAPEVNRLKEPVVLHSETEAAKAFLELADKVIESVFKK
ncbi:Mrp/NBP35 family ATP-binding protein [Thermosulfurimonas dismutans]|uniref:Iron-sulfur cluster carrier protein n=1 Tax=Thermosulfurimonas dismutans TaxID=999894 RepID=A0A179D616_9BACT|nr:Mrp/NBP35 family ATP-binding protein [Thermosulfurimonas dismutans]OAQ21497.1 Chromosome partitioning ATPase, Mrp family [Thermosulfurimonas dismutans]